MRPRLARPLLLLAAVTAGAALVVGPAAAACHVAGFVQDEVTGDEGGPVTLTVELKGRVASCAGTVDVRTVDGTAVAGADYEALTTTLTFEEGDDRVEEVTVVLFADEEAEATETFTVELTEPTGGIASTSGPATVSVVDAGGEPEVEDPATQAASEPSVPVDGDGVAPDGDTGTGGNTLVVLVIAMAVIGGAAFLGRRGR